MKPPKKLLSEAQIHRVNDAVAAASHRTAAKIVPVVASCSGRYDRADELVGWWAAALGLALTGILVTQPITFSPGPNSSADRWALNLGMVLIVIVVGSAIGAILATRVGLLRRMFLPKRMMAEVVHQRAAHVLRDCRIRAGGETPRRPIVVIFVSLYERRVELIADDDLQGRLAAVAVEPIQAVILEAIADGRLCGGLCQAVSMTAELISPICPSEALPRDHRPEVMRIID